MKKIEVGENSVVQVNELGPKEFVGCFVIVAEVRKSGIQGRVPIPNNEGTVWINLEWNQLEYIGAAALIAVTKA